MSDTTDLKAVKQLITAQQRRDFAGIYGKILDLAMIEAPVATISALIQYYDQYLKCFTFRDFQLVPTLEEFEKILGCPIGGSKPYFPSCHSPSMPRLADVLGIPEGELREKEMNRNGVRSFPRKYLEAKEREYACREEWGYFMNILTLLIYRVLLFPNISGRIDLASVDVFLAYYYRVVVHADMYCTLDLSWEKKSTRVICSLPALYVWMVSHFVIHNGRPTCLLEDFRMAPNKNKINWEELLARVTGSTVPEVEGGAKCVMSVTQCGAFPNVPLMGTKGCIYYNPIPGISQLRYPICGPPTDEVVKPFIARGLDEARLSLYQLIRKAWYSPDRRSKELRKRGKDVMGSYWEWLKNRVAKVKLPKRSDNEEIQTDVSLESEKVKALKVELEKAKTMMKKLKG